MCRSLIHQPGPRCCSHKTMRGCPLLLPRAGTRPPCTASAEASGEGEEHLLHLLLAHRGIAASGEALPHPARHDLETGPVQARDTAASWVTTSVQFRPASTIAMT